MFGSIPAVKQVARINIPPTLMPEAERYGRVQRDILERIEALPGVTAAGFSYGVRMEGRPLDGTIFVADRPYAIAMALCLGVVGIYGVISYVVSQRSREIGIQLALGAPAPAVQRMIVLHGLAVATIGVAAGVAAAAGFGGWMGSLLFEVRPLDPVTYAAVLGMLLAAVALAAYVPARRAAKCDPVETLRAE